MIGRLLLGALSAAVVLMIWGFLSWVVMPPEAVVFSSVDNESAFSEQLVSTLQQSGSYRIPMPPHKNEGEGSDAFETFLERHRSGPTALLFISMKGSDPLSPRIFLMGFGHYFLSTLLVGLILLLAKEGLETYMSRAIMVAGMGLFASVSTNLSPPIWWQVPWAFHVYTAIFGFIGWLLAGLVLAAIVRPAKRHGFSDQSKPLWKRALDMD